MLVTSRDQLRGLVARDGAARLLLDVLTPDEARALLVRLLSPERVAAEPDPAARLAHLCGYLPLALRIAAANLTRRPRVTVAAYADRLFGYYQRHAVGAARLLHPDQRQTSRA